MSGSALKDQQATMARYLRNPEGEAPPAGVEARRLKIYEDLVYNNIENFINTGFPVLRSLYEKDDWRDLVRAFMQEHRCHSPYFLEISQEFLQFLMQDYVMRACDPPFMTELAHYEWVELALDVSQETLPPLAKVEDMLAAVPSLSPLAWSLAYHYPVHRIGTSFRPQEADEPTYLVVYRDRQDKVRFLEVNAATARLLELLRDNTSSTVADLLELLAMELGMEPEALRGFGLEQLGQLVEQSVVVVTNAAAGG